MACRCSGFWHNLNQLSVHLKTLSPPIYFLKSHTMRRIETEEERRKDDEEEEEDGGEEEEEEEWDSC